MKRILHIWLSLGQDRRAVTALEYALIVALVGLAISTAALALGNNMSTVFTKLGTTLARA